MRVQPNVALLAVSPGGEQTVAMAAKLCYSRADVGKLQKGIERREQGPFVERLMSMGHLSALEHISFTFAIEGVSRSFLAQITRHRIASFSVQSQRYVELGGDTGGFGYVVPPAIEALGEESLRRF